MCLYIPVRYNSNKTGLVFIVDNAKQKIEDGYISEISTSLPSAINELSPAEIITRFYSYRNTLLTGSIRSYSITNKFRWELGFKNGISQYRKVHETLSLNESQNNRKIKTNSVKVNNCVAYYLVVYWDDGTVDRYYLGASCSDDCEQTIKIGDSGLRISTNCRGSVGTVMGGTSTYNITNSITNPCLKGMVASLTSGKLTDSISQTFNRLFSVSDNNNVLFTESSSLASDVSGATSVIAGDVGIGMDIRIALNVNVLPSTSAEYVAETILHEMLHAILDNSTTLRSEFLQHGKMVDYINTERGVLQNLFPNLTDANANGLIISGLSSLASDQFFWNALLNDYNLTENDLITTRNQFKDNVSNGKRCSNSSFAKGETV